MDCLPTIYFVYDEICLNLFSVFMAGLWLYSIPYAVPQSGRLIWWRIALGWSGALPADSRTQQWGYFSAYRAVEPQTSSYNIVR